MKNKKCWKKQLVDGPKAQKAGLNLSLILLINQVVLFSVSSITLFQEIYITLLPD